MAETTERPSLTTRTQRAQVLGRTTHAVFKRGVLHANHCQLCGTQIAGLVPSDQHAERQIVNGKTVIRERLVFAYFANYREALLEFDDGTRHVACVCADCAPRLSDPATADDVYSAAVSQWVSEGVRLAPRLVQRKVTRTVGVDTVIQG